MEKPHTIVRGLRFAATSAAAERLAGSERPENRHFSPLSCKFQYYIKSTSAYFSGRSAFLTDDGLKACNLVLGLPRSSVVTLQASSVSPVFRHRSRRSRSAG